MFSGPMVNAAGLIGDFIKKPMRDCTGAEMFAELLYHCGLKDQIAGILAHSKVSTA